MTAADFLTTFMTFALNASGAERGMAVDGDLNVIGLHNLAQAEVEAPIFSGFENIRQAYERNERPHITNNQILDPTEAPKTNTNFANLRLVVVFPFDDLGSVYMDQHVSTGAPAKNQIERLMRVAVAVIDSGDLNVSVADLQTIYARL
jgi:hypothetical protein